MVGLSASNNFVQDLFEMKEKGEKLAIYFSLFESKNDVIHLENALSILGLKISGVLVDNDLMKLRHISTFKNINKVVTECKYNKVSMEYLKSMDQKESIVIIVKNHIDYFGKIISFFNQSGLNCTLFHNSSIKSSAVINGSVKVVDRVSYLNDNPWFYDVINKDIPEIHRKKVKSSMISGKVVSNGKYLYMKEISTVYSEILNGFRKVSDHVSTDVDKNVTLLGDSRFLNSFYPTEYTLPYFIQEYFNSMGMNYKVNNFSVIANKMQNAMAMLKSLELNANSIIICYSCVVDFFDVKPNDDNTRTMVRFSIMKEMTEYCKKYGAEILFLHLPYLGDVPNMTKIESFIAESYSLTYKQYYSQQLIMQLCMANDVKYVDLTAQLINTQRTSLFIDTTHFSIEGCRVIAKSLCGYICAITEKDSILKNDKVKVVTDKCKQAFQKYVMNSCFEGLWDHMKELEKISQGKPENCGAIVMNCNPFTLGHRYLIETAVKQVDYLYILVVQEDHSVFKFKDRFEMVKRGTADLKNVEVIPSGRFVISDLTFPDYFDKNQKQDDLVDTTIDLEVFCNVIAPALRVTTRFVGEEPLDRVTLQYNDKMKEILPQHNINVVVVPRKEMDSMPISASLVRKLLIQKKYEDFRRIVPITTYDYLLNQLEY